MKKAKIFVCIVTYNSSDYILDCLSSVNSSKTIGFELKIVVVDNCSTDDTVKKIKSFSNQISIIMNKQNLGFSGGINVAIQSALLSGADYIFILNPDTLLKTDTIQKLFNKRQLADILSPKIYFSNPSDTIWYAGGRIDWDNCLGNHIGVDEKDTGQFDKIVNIDYSTGCGELINSNVFKKIGLMNEKYFLYLEDLDFSLRAKKSGFKIKFIPSSSMYHHNAKSSSVGSPIQDYFITRNRIYFALNYAPLKTKAAVLKQSLGFLFHGRPAQKTAVIDFLTLRMYKGSIFKKI